LPTSVTALVSSARQRILGLSVIAPVGQPVYFCGGVVSERRSWPATQDTCPKHCRSGRLACKGAVHAPVERLPSVIVQLRVDHAGIETG
jgi:hypothetical protein